MMNPDDLDPPKAQQSLKDLSPLSIAELREYIHALQAEIARAEADIVKKERDKLAADALFRKI